MLRVASGQERSFVVGTFKPITAEQCRKKIVNKIFNTEVYIYKKKLFVH